MSKLNRFIALSLVLSCGIAFAAAKDATRLEAGFATIDITPGGGTVCPT